MAKSEVKKEACESNEERKTQMSNQKRNKIYAISYLVALGFDSDSNILVTDPDYSVTDSASFSSRLLVTDSNILVTDSNILVTHSDYSAADSGKF